MIPGRTFRFAMRPGSWRVRALLRLVLLTLAQQLPAQVVQITAGTSSLDQTTGAQLAIHAETYAATLGAGSIGGRFFAGGHLARQFEHGQLTLGTEQIPLDLPTDVFETGHYLTGFGVGYTNIADTARTYVFAGATAAGFNTPFFSAASVQDPAVIFKASDTLSDTAEVSTTIVLGRQPTILGSAAWNLTPSASSASQTHAAATVGLGAGQPYSAFSFSTHRARFDLDAAYIAAVGRFRRVLLQTPVNSEPDRENIQLVLRVSPRAGITLARQNFLTPIYQSNDNTRSRVNQATGNLQLLGASLAATVSDSSDGTRGNLASFASASRSLGSRTDVQLAWLASRPSNAAASSAYISTLRRTVTPRWSVSGTINRSGGQVTYGSGAAFLSNLATVSADYEFFYLPNRLDQPFQHALICNVQLHLLGRVLLTGTTFLAPDGKLLYTTGGNGLLSTGGFPIAATTSPSHDAIGRMVLRGRVILSTGEPVAGAALLVDHLLVYTDSRGRFELRERKVHQHMLLLQGDRFLEGGTYRSIVAPTIAWSSPSQNAGQEETFIVTRLPQRAGPPR